MKLRWHKGSLTMIQVSLKNKNWVVPKVTEQLLTKVGWVRFVTTESADVSAQHLLARLGCEPKRLVLENPVTTIKIIDYTHTILSSEKYKMIRILLQFFLFQ